VSSDNKKTRIVIDSDACIGCSLCIQICPESFEMDENGNSWSKAGVAPENIDNGQQAIDSCPVQCMSWDGVGN